MTGVFMRRSILAVLSILALAALASPALAGDDTPLLSLDRASAGVTSNYAWYQNAGSQASPEFSKEFEFGAVAAYNLVSQPGGKAPLLSATYSLNYGVDNKFWRHRLGLTLVLWKGSDR